MRFACLTILALLLAAPATAQIVDVVCPDGVRFMGELHRCPCCETCPDGTWILEGEEECEPLSAEATSDTSPEADSDDFSLALQVLSVGLACVFLFTYFLPAFIAHRRKHPQRTAITLLTLFLAWTLLGWVAALVWAATAVEKREP
jgi:hypothetical protein